MSILLFSILLLLGSFAAGLIGALTGLGGGVVIIPLLVLLFHVNMHFAMGASLVSVMATSSGTTAAYLREGYTNLRIGLFLEIAAVIGALVGASLIAFVSKTFLSFIFIGILFISAYLTLRRKEEQENYTTSHVWAQRFRLDGTYPDRDKIKPYKVQNVPAAFLVMCIAGILSGLLGIGSGALKVLAMDQTLKLPYKVATTTSNFMIGITAAVSAGIYFAKGYINALVTFPVLLGVIAGSYCGAKLLTRIPHQKLRILFSIVICLMGLQMLWETTMGNIQ